MPPAIANIALPSVRGWAPTVWSSTVPEHDVWPTGQASWTLSFPLGDGLVATRALMSGAPTGGGGSARVAIVVNGGGGGAGATATFSFTGELTPLRLSRIVSLTV